MAQRGPKPTPTKVLQMRGSWLAKARQNEPQPPQVIPKMPKDLDPEARKIWRKLTRDLAGIGLLASLDQHALARYIQLWQRWQKLHAFVVEHGETYEVKQVHTIEAHYDYEGNLVSSQRLEYVDHMSMRAETRTWMALHDRLLKMEQQFGMTPSGRAAIGILLAGAKQYAEQEKPDPKRFLSLG